MSKALRKSAKVAAKRDDYPRGERAQRAWKINRAAEDRKSGNRYYAARHLAEVRAHWSFPEAVNLP